MTIKQSKTPDIIDILWAIEVPEKLTDSLEKIEIATPVDASIVEKKEIASPLLTSPQGRGITQGNISLKIENKTPQKSILNIVQTRIKENISNVQASIEATTKNVEKNSKNLSRLLSAWIFGAKYIITSVGIFAVLLLTTNYSAYSNIAKSYIFEDQIALESQSLLNWVDAASVNKEELPIKKTKQDRVKALKESEKQSAVKQNQFSIKKLVDKLDKEDINLDIAIVPYENRIVIPKIGKNIPLIDIKETTVDGKSQLDNIFMKELEEGIVRYPGSAYPGEKWNSFIFGHSSNFPWIAWDYNDVFSRLGQVEVGDVVYSYYGQKKYKYKIKEKRVISPNDVSILKRDKNKSELTLMTCWPIGTTLNRLILIWEIVED